MTLRKAIGPYTYTVTVLANAPICVGKENITNPHNEVLCYLNRGDDGATWANELARKFPLRPSEARGLARGIKGLFDGTGFFTNISREVER